VAIAELQKVRPGGVILFGVNLGKKKEIRALTKGLQNEMKNLNSPPLFISIDQEGGRVVRVEKGVTGFPGALAIGQTKNPAYAFNVGLITSYELNNLGINLLLAPVMDINNNPENPVINTRSFGMTLDAGDLAISYEKGARIGGAVPVIKHFPGHGDTNVDSHLGLPVIEKTESQLLEFELIPFQKSIQEGARAVMSAHIVYPNLDPKYPSTLSKKILTDIQTILCSIGWLVPPIFFIIKLSAKKTDQPNLSSNIFCKKNTDDNAQCCQYSKKHFITSN